MSIKSEWINRLRYAGRRARFDYELDDEIRFHVETRTAELERSGFSPNDALAQARREFGSVTRMREDSRSAWQFAWLEDLAADLRYAFRAFRRNPGFTLTAVTRRTREIGIRVALGSGSGKILAMVAREAGLLVGAGSIAGVAIAVATARLLSRVLPPTASLAPSLLAVCAGTMLAITALAAFVPAIRACRVDPMAALRHE
jgi:hypothetical protein